MDTNAASIPSCGFSKTALNFFLVVSDFTATEITPEYKINRTSLEAKSSEVEGQGP